MCRDEPGVVFFQVGSDRGLHGAISARIVLLFFAVSQAHEDPTGAFGTARLWLSTSAQLTSVYEFVSFLRVPNRIRNFVHTS